MSSISGSRITSGSWDKSCNSSHSSKLGASFSFQRSAALPRNYHEAQPHLAGAGGIRASSSIKVPDVVVYESNRDDVGIRFTYNRR